MCPPPRVLVLAAVLFATACRSSAPASPPSAAAPQPSAASPADASLSCASRAHRIDDAPLPPFAAGEGTLLERAARHYDAQRFEDALACAVQAAAAEPTRVEAQSERAAALVAVGRNDEARLAFSRALALDPDYADALLGAADLYLNRLEATRENEELALAYAARGYANAHRAKDKKLAADFALLQAGALNFLGRSGEALARAEEALAAGADELRARSERAAALWELCRFDDARREYLRLVDDPDHRASAHHHLGLLAERDGDVETARVQFDSARALAPEDYPAPIAIEPQEFVQLVAREVAALDEETRKDLEGVNLTTQDLPDLDDLVADEPPLSPEIIGLFRGPPLGDACEPEATCAGPCRSIVLYRKNLSRVARTREEFDKQVRQTLLHEVGHLRGEDDVQLVARGLE